MRCYNQLIWWALSLLLVTGFTLVAEEKSPPGKSPSGEANKSGNKPEKSEKTSKEPSVPPESVISPSAGSALKPTGTKEVTQMLEQKIMFPAVGHDGITLSDELDYIRTMTGINIITEDIDPHGITISWTSDAPVRIKDALKAMLSPDNDYLIDEEGIVVITTQVKVFTARLETRSYNVLDLVIEMPVFTAPAIGLVPPHNPPPQDTPKPRVTSDELVSLIEEHLGKNYGGFDQNKAPGASVEFKSPYLIVRHLPEVHEEVEQLLQLLR